MCLHEVYGGLRGSGAVLECRLCKATVEVREGEFEAMNQFIGRHRACLPMDATP